MGSIFRPAMAGTLAFCFAGLAHAAWAGGADVTISGFAFDPPTLTVPVGTTVTWTNKDEEPHTVSSVDRRINSPPLDGDDRFSLAFTAPGTYDYFCRLHPHMVGHIVVMQ